MTQTITENAPAKVNLALHVTGRRDDGYHLLDSLVMFTQAGDRIHVRAGSQDRFLVEGPFAAHLGDSEDNLVLRARNLFRELTGHRSPVEIVLEKNLPVASGIGGGSSDAAATLRALMRLRQVEIDPENLARQALTLGADLPMCLGARTLVARGIGEDITFVPSLPPLALVLVNPGVAVSTPAIFRALARSQNAPLPPLSGVSDFASLVAWLAATRNDLETPAASLVPAIGDVLFALATNGAAVARMSGSGATCFGVFSSDDAATAAADALARSYPSWYVKATRTI